MALSLTTEIELTTGEVLKLSDFKPSDEVYVYTIEASGRIGISKIKDINILPSQKVKKYNFKNGKNVILNNQQDLLFHECSKYATDINEKFLVTFAVNPMNDRIYCHASKLYYPSLKIAHEIFNLYDEEFPNHKDRNLVESLTEEQLNHANAHINLILSVTGTKLQLLLRLSIDPFLCNMLNVEYLSVSEVEQLCEKLEIQFKDNVYSEKDFKLLQILMSNVSDDPSETMECYLETVKSNYNIDNLKTLTELIDGDELTLDHLNAIALSLGYSYFSHLKSIKDMFGTSITTIEDLDDIEDCCEITLDDGSTTLGLSCGIFVNI